MKRSHIFEAVFLLLFLNMDKLIQNIKEASGKGINVLDFQFMEQDILIPDLSDSNRELDTVDLDNAYEFGTWLNQKMATNSKKIAIGGYGEDRVVYKRSKHFGQGPDSRSIHLGIDLWIDAGTKVLAPFDAELHSFQNNDNHGDYGGTIILSHKINGQTFHTLYGHLSLNSLDGKVEGMKIRAGEAFAELGAPQENGGWPPHLHFQVIRDMGDKKGDYFGVASPSEKEERLFQCPDPNYILNIQMLK
jgi:murein DD-endopeptidase MepM/ murein hydrolase activator NlpD